MFGKYDCKTHKNGECIIKFQRGERLRNWKELEMMVSHYERFTSNDFILIPLKN